MGDKRLSQKLQEKLSRLEEKTGAITTGFLTGAGVGGAMKLAGKGGGFLKGAIKGATAGLVVELLLLGGAGINQLIKKAREKGASETKASIRKAVSRAQDSTKYTNTQKATIKSTGQAAIAKIDQAFKNQKKHESFLEQEECCKDCKKENDVKDKEEPKEESLGNRILSKLNSMVEEATGKKAAAAGAVGGGAAALMADRSIKRAAVSNAVKQRNTARAAVKNAAKATKEAVNKSGAAKTIMNKEVRHATQLAKKNPSGIIGKLKNAGAKLAQKGRVQQAAKNVAGHADVAKNLNNLKKANDTYKKSNTALKGAKSALRSSKSLMSKVKTGGKGALAGAALAGAAYLGKKAYDKYSKK